jgi:hypothetical protein
MSKSCPVVTAECVFLGAQQILGDDSKPTGDIYLNFVSDEFIPDYNLPLHAKQIVEATKDKPKPNLRFRVDESTARSHALKIHSVYRVKYAFEVSSFTKQNSNGTDGTVAYNRKWIQSIELVNHAQAA